MQLPAIIVTDSEGQHRWSGKYSAWGKVSRQNVRNVGQSTVSQFAQPLRYPGQYNDDETGLHYNTFRYYDPEIGRFTTQDPIGLAGGLNLYAYAPNPLRWIDPLGLHEFLSDTDIVCRAGACTVGSFSTGSGVITGESGKLSGISTQAKPGAGLETLSQPFQHNQVGVATVGDIEKAGGTITLDGKLNSANGNMVMNHATVDGLTAQQAQELFQPTEQNPIPKGERGVKGGC